VSVVYNCCWSSLAKSLFGPSPVGLVIIFYSLRFETSLLIASKDSQGYGERFRTRLHPGLLFYSLSVDLLSSLFGLIDHTSSYSPLCRKRLLRCCQNNVYRTVVWQWTSLLFSDCAISSFRLCLPSVDQQPTVPAGSPGCVYQQAVTYAMDSHI
jgi:hypothetical protein